MPPVDVRRADDRFRTEYDGIDTRHAFSFCRHYDPANTSFGALLLHDEHRLEARRGFASHPHRELEIVTWVLAGELVHEDSTGRRGVVRPGQVQRMGAGTGVVHSETAGAGAAHVVQAWLPPDEPGRAPQSEQQDVADALGSGELVPVASGRPGDAVAVRLGTSGAALHVARLGAGAAVELPDAPRVHLFVARGTVELEDAGPLGTADAARLTGSGGRRVTATGAAELLIWELP